MSTKKYFVITIHILLCHKSILTSMVNFFQYIFFIKGKSAVTSASLLSKTYCFFRRFKILSHSALLTTIIIFTFSYTLNEIFISFSVINIYSKNVFIVLYVLT